MRRLFIIAVLVLSAFSMAAGSPPVAKSRAKCGACSAVVVFKDADRGKVARCWACRARIRLPVLPKLRKIINPACRGGT